ncbi:MAG: hypothetical protein ABSG43_22995 [Solirubrobacteraceae bacterium]|jgi:hypothetical protein
MTAHANESVTDLFERARRAHESIRVEPAGALMRAFDAGDALNAAKALVEHGEWTADLEKIGIPASTARLYMQLARSREIVMAAGCTSIRGARQLLSDSKPRRPSSGGGSRGGAVGKRGEGGGGGKAESDRYQEGYGDGYRAGRADGYTQGAAKAGRQSTNGRWQPTSRDLRWLIKVAHPDHHQDPAEILKATRATAWLKEQLAEARGREG